MGERMVRLEGLPGDTRPRVSATHTYMPRAYVAWKRAAVAVLAEAGLMRHDGPVAVELMVVIGRPLVPPLRAGSGRRPHVGRPDVDNVAKGVLDALTEAGVLIDDKQVAELVVRRVWGEVRPHAPSYARDARERSGCEVRVRAIGGGA